MRIGIGLVIVGAVVGGIVMHRHREEPVVQPPAVTAPAPASVLASPRPPSPHNWAKSALDRAAEAKSKVAEQHKQNDGN